MDRCHTGRSDFHLWLQTKQNLWGEFGSLSTSLPHTLQRCAKLQAQRWREKEKTKNNNGATIDFLFRHHLRLCPFFQSDKILTTFTPPLLPFHPHPPSPLPNSFILPKPPPVLCCGFPPCLYFRSLPFFWPNWNCSLWNGKVIYIDSRGIWLAVLSGATCNVTGNKAPTNILPPPLSAAKSPPGQRVTSNRNLEKVKVCQEAIVNFCWPFLFPPSSTQ